MNPVKKPTFFSVYNDLAGSFLRYMALSGDCSVEEIHLLRLDVKSLRTVLDLVEFIMQKKSATRELRAMLSRIFDKAGDVRTAQMNLALLRMGRAGVVEAYERALLDEEMESRRELNRLMTAFDRERFQRLAGDTGVLIAGLENARVAVYAAKFIRGRYDAIFRILKKVRTPRDLHEIRINVKSVRNAIRLISGWGRGRRTGIEERIVKTADQALGTWHDGIVFAEHLRRFISKHRKSPARRELNALALERAEKNDAGFSGIVRETRQRMTALRTALELY